MKKKKYHFGKRWAIKNKHGMFETTGMTWTKDIIDARIYRVKSEVKSSCLDMLEWRGCEVVCIKETVYVVEE